MSGKIDRTENLALAQIIKMLWTKARLYCSYFAEKSEERFL